MYLTGLLGYLSSGPWWPPADAARALGPAAAVMGLVALSCLRAAAFAYGSAATCRRNGSFEPVSRYAPDSVRWLGTGPGGSTGAGLRPGRSSSRRHRPGRRSGRAPGVPALCVLLVPLLLLPRRPSTSAVPPYRFFFDHLRPVAAAGAPAAQGLPAWSWSVGRVRVDLVGGRSGARRRAAGLVAAAVGWPAPLVLQTM